MLAAVNPICGANTSKTVAFTSFQGRLKKYVFHSSNKCLTVYCNPNETILLSKVGIFFCNRLVERGVRWLYVLVVPSGTCST